MLCLWWLVTGETAFGVTASAGRRGARTKQNDQSLFSPPPRADDCAQHRAGNTPQSRCSGTFPSCPFAVLPKRGVASLLLSAGSYSGAARYLIN